MERRGLGFAFARDNRVAIDGDRLVTGPEPTMAGLREARRVAAHPLTPEPCDAAGFQTRLAALFDDAEAREEAVEVAFDIADGEQRGGARDILEDPEDAPVIQLVNQLLRRAVRLGASDLHIEPHEEGLRARMRLDGTLQTALDRRDVRGRRVVSRLKVMAGLDIAETRLPQDGRIALRLGGRAIDVRMSSLPGHYGERVVLRLLDRSEGLVPLDALGLGADQAELLQHLAAQPNGIILATGPTGSGKTTTLYSLLQLADRGERNIVTVEDPVEYDLPGVSQSQVNAEIGMTFAIGLRAVLRQDPDVILVGEIRDTETATVAAEAALTGHLVFSSLHANSALATIVRLRELGVDNYLISATLRGVIAQRLLRRLCTQCSVPHAPSDAEAALYRDGGAAPPERLHAARGCAACEQTGYSGRIGVFEIVAIDDALRGAIDAGASEQRMREIGHAPEAGLFARGLSRAARGETSLAEVTRVLGDTQ